MKNKKQTKNTKLSMKQTIKNFLKTVSNLITLFNNLLKKIFSNMVQNCKIFYIISVQLKNRLFSNNIKSPILTLLSLLYLGTLLISFMWIFEYNLIDMFQLIILSLFSFAVSIFISDNYKFSNNKFIFWLQKIVYYSFNFALIVLVGWMLYLVGVNLSILGSIFLDSDVSSVSSVSSVSNNKTDSGDNGKDWLIPSILESGDELSPLQMILNYEIILGISIYFHIGLLILIWLHKLYVSSVWNIISKLFSKETITKYEKIQKIMEKIGKRYLIILVIINVVFILFDLGIIIYANIELSNNIDDFIHVHLKMKNSIIMLLFVKSKFIVNKNKILKMKMKLKRQMILSKKIIQQLSNQMINQLKLNKNIQITQSFSLFGFIFSQLNLNVDETASSLTQISYGVFLLSFVALICFLNVVGFMITYVLIQKGNYEIKYPKLRKFINYYKKSTLVYVSIEALLCLICLILLVYFSFLYVYYGIKP